VVLSGGGVIDGLNWYLCRPSGNRHRHAQQPFIRSHGGSVVVDDDVDTASLPSVRKTSWREYLDGLDRSLSE